MPFVSKFDDADIFELVPRVRLELFVRGGIGAAPNAVYVPLGVSTSVPGGYGPYKWELLAWFT